MKAITETPDGRGARGRASREWSIQEVARLAGTTSRTLRHYDDVGLLAPSRVGDNGYRYYDQTALVRLQRILLLRELGLGLPAIAEVLGGEQDAVGALHTHLDELKREQQRLARQISTVETTLHQLRRGEPLMAEDMFDGFDSRRYEDEVVERWGRDAHERSQRQWKALGREGQREKLAEQEALAQALAEASQRGDDVAGDAVQALVRRHHAWVSFFHAYSREAYIGLGEMYVADPRFTAVYDRHAPGTARFLRDAMCVYAEANLA